MVFLYILSVMFILITVIGISLWFKELCEESIKSEESTRVINVSYRQIARIEIDHWRYDSSELAKIIKINNGRYDPDHYLDWREKELKQGAVPFLKEEKIRQDLSLKPGQRYVINELPIKDEETTVFKKRWSIIKSDIVSTFKSNPWDYLGWLALIFIISLFITVPIFIIYLLAKDGSLLSVIGSFSFLLLLGYMFDRQESFKRKQENKRIEQYERNFVERNQTNRTVTQSTGYSRGRNRRASLPATAKEAYRKYLQSSRWKKVRSRVLKEANYSCESCGGYANVAHHTRYPRGHRQGNPSRENYDYLVALCSRCHNEIHGRSK